MKIDTKFDYADKPGLHWILRVIAVALGLFFLALVSGCEAQTYSSTHRYVLPTGMEDCKIFVMRGEGISRDLYAIRCPISTTSTNWAVSSGKHTSHHTTVTIDGTEYDLVPKDEK